MGKRIGRYVVQRLVGAGGMGEVYLARDTELDRSVALKMLPLEIVGDEARRTRLRREARLAASISHPHVATVFEVFDHEGAIVLAMEFVEGQSLRQLIGGHALPMSRVLRIGSQVADALGAAHRQGVIHRDIKPDNILVTLDGHAKVTDFGLAREGVPVSGEAPARDHTISEPLTEPGTVFGTAPYIAPEQIRGQPATPESDIFSLGATLYEAATGRRAFDGATTADTFARILRDRPAVPSSLNPEVPPDLDRILARALEKDPSDRYHDARDLAGDLRDLRRRMESGVLTPSAPLAVPKRSAWLAIAIAAVALVVGAVVLTLVLQRAGAPGPAAAARSPEGKRLRPLVTSEGEIHGPAISRDGTMVAYVEKHGEWAQLFVTRTRGGGRVLLTDDPGEKAQPAFSPDGETLAFSRWDPETRTPSIFFTPTLGGTPRRVVTDATFPCWSPDGQRIAFIDWGGGREQVLATVRVDGSDRRDLLRAAADRPFLRDPNWSPDGATIVFVRSAGGQSAEIWTIPAAGGAATRRIEDAVGVYSSEPVFTPDGNAIIHTSNRAGSPNLWSIAAHGPAAPVRLTTGTGPDLTPGVARDGRIVFATEHSRVVLEVVDRATGRRTELFRDASPLWAPRFAPDASEVAFSRAESGGGWHVWTVPSGGGAAKQLTFGDLPEIFPRYTPDGRFVLFQTWSPKADRIWRVPRGGGTPEPVTPERDDDDAYPDIAPDGKRIAFTRTTAGVDRVHIMPLAGGEAVGLTHEPSTLAAWSPDGAWIAFARDRSTESGIFLIRPDGSDEHRISNIGGWPAWRRDGRSVAFEATAPDGRQEIRSVTIADGAAAGSEKIVYQGSNFPFDYAPDGKRLVTTNAVIVASEIWLLEP